MTDPDPTDPGTGGPPGRARLATRLRVGGATDVGMVRDANQDSMLLADGVSVVADGMGGHAGGEVASRIAVESIEASLPDPAERALRVLDLVLAVQAANDHVWERSGDDPHLAGMGTTVVAAAVVVEDGEERIAIVNVGDSRAYRLSGGHLDQVSEDHSYVGELVREGRLSPEDARHHPRKNIVTRAIGIEEVVDVDEFQLLPRTGDRYLLCSDGLTDEVDEDEIAHVLRTVADPDEAAETLVALANEHGGRDNTTVVIVDVVADGLGDRAAVPDDEHFSAHPDADTQGIDPVTGAVADGGAGGHTAGGDTVGAPRSPRVVTVRSLAFVVAVLVVVAAGAGLAWNQARNTYVVTIEDDEVTILRGRSFLWFEPTFVEGTDIALDDLPRADRDRLADGVDQPSLSDARRFVDNLEERIADFTPPVTAPSSTTSTTRTTSTTTSTSPTTTGSTTTTTEATAGP